MEGGPGSQAPEEKLKAPPDAIDPIDNSAVRKELAAMVRAVADDSEAKTR